MGGNSLLACDGQTIRSQEKGYGTFHSFYMSVVLCGDSFLLFHHLALRDQIPARVWFRRVAASYFDKQIRQLHDNIFPCLWCCLRTPVDDDISGTGRSL